MKLHLGCGEKYLEGFVHVDLLDYNHIDYKAPIDDLHFAKDSSVEMILYLLNSNIHIVCRVWNMREGWLVHKYIKIIN